MLEGGKRRPRISPKLSDGSEELARACTQIGSAHPQLRRIRQHPLAAQQADALRSGNVRPKEKPPVISHRGPSIYFDVPDVGP